MKKFSITKKQMDLFNFIKDYMDSLDPIIGLIKECEDGRSIDELLEGPVSHSTFKRLN